MSPRPSRQRAARSVKLGSEALTLGPPETAVYIGEAGKLGLDGTPLIPGITVADVPNGEAELSDLWSPVEAGDFDSLPLSTFDGGDASGPQIGVLDGGTS